MPGFKCIYLHCSSRTGSNISMFSLPRDPVRCDKWLIAAGREDLFGKGHRSYKLCEDHFESKYFSVSTISSKRLHDNAIPSIFAGPKRKFEFVLVEPPRKGKILADVTLKPDETVVLNANNDRSVVENRGDAAQRTEQSYINTGELVLNDVIKEEVEDDVIAEPLDKLLITKEDLLTIVNTTNSDKIAEVDVVKEEPESEDENEPSEKINRPESDQISNNKLLNRVKEELEYEDENEPLKKKNKLESDQISKDLDQPGPSRAAATSEIEQNDPALDNMLTCSEDLDTFFKTIATVAKTLDPIDQVTLQRNISNVVFDMKIKEMTNRKS